MISKCVEPVHLLIGFPKIIGAFYQEDEVRARVCQMLERLSSLVKIETVQLKCHMLRPSRSCLALVLSIDVVVRSHEKYLLL